MEHKHKEKPTLISLVHWNGTGTSPDHCCILWLVIMSRLHSG